MMAEQYRDIFGGQGQILNGVFVPYASQEEADAMSASGPGAGQGELEAAKQQAADAEIRASNAEAGKALAESKLAELEAKLAALTAEALKDLALDDKQVKAVLKLVK